MVAYFDKYANVWFAAMISAELLMEPRIRLYIYNVGEQTSCSGTVRNVVWYYGYSGSVCKLPLHLTPPQGPKATKGGATRLAPYTKELPRGGPFRVL